MRVDRAAADAPNFDKFTKADDIPPGDVEQAIEGTHQTAARAGGLEDFPEALDDDDDDLPF